MSSGTRDIPLLITCAIRASAPRTKLADQRERLRCTLDAVAAWVTLNVFARIVICDGSGYDLSADVTRLAASRGSATMFEFLSFNNDTNLVTRLGKGYGEGEIVRHALHESRLLADAPSFAKCTGKLWVSNAAACVRHYNGVAAFNLAGGLVPKYVDTRFYLCSRHFYEARLGTCHHAVDENHGRYLERCFMDSLKGTHLYRNATRPTPVIRGVSGSMGVEHHSSRMNNLVKDVRNVVLAWAGC